MIYVIKKDGTREEFDSRKIIAAVNKSAARILYTFSEEEKDFICRFAEEHAESLGKNEIQIQEMHNIVEGALERVNPAVAKSYRDYRNYKLAVIHMMDDAAGASSFAQAAVPRKRNSMPLPVQSRAGGRCSGSIRPIRRIPGVDAVISNV